MNITSGAVFTSEGTFDVKDFNIASNALFNMNNTVTTAEEMTNAGVLFLGHASQTLNSQNGYVQSNGGVFKTEVVSDVSYGQLAVDNAVDLSQSGNIAVQVSQNASLKTGDVLGNVISGGSLAAPTGGFNVTDNSVIWKFIASPSSSNGVDLTAAVDSSAYNICRGNYCQGAANVIIQQVTAGNAAFSPYAALGTASAFQTAVSQATPELTNENIPTTQLITQTVMNDIPMWNVLHGVSQDNALSFDPGRTVWAKPYGASTNQNESDTVNGFNSAVYGLVVGRDFQPSDKGWIGGAFAAGGDSISGKSVLSGQSVRGSSYEGMLYGTKAFANHLYVAGQGLLGYGNNNTRRSMPVDASTATGAYNSWFTDLRTQLGWNGYVRKDLVLTPVLDINYLFVNQGGYQESGSPMNLSVASDNNSSLVLGAYGYGAYHLTTTQSQNDLTLTGYAGLAQDLLGNQPETTATFAAGGSSFSTFGIPLNQLVFRGGLGMVVSSLKKPLSMSLNYGLQAGGSAYSNMGTLTLAYKMAT